MTWYKEGTVNVTSGSNAVIGTGTAFIANSRVGDAFRGPDGNWYEVVNIASNTAMSITPNYQSATESSSDYAITPIQGYNKDTADALRAASLVIGNSANEAATQVSLAKGYADAASLSKTEASISENNASSSAAVASAASVSAASSASSANTSAVQASEAAEGLGRFLLPKTSLPTTRDDGSPLEVGDKVLITTNGVEYVYKTSGWVANNIDTQQLASSSGASIVGYNTETVATALTRAGQDNKYAWGNVKQNGTDSATFGPNLAPALSGFTKVGFDSNGILASGSSASMKAVVAIPAFSQFKLTVTVTTNAPGSVQFKLGTANIFDDTPEGYYFSNATILADGIEQDRVLSSTVYTFLAFTSGSAWTELSAVTDTVWAGTISSIEFCEVNPTKFAVAGCGDDSNGPKNPVGLKVFGYNRNDMVIGDKFTLGMFSDDGQPLMGAHNVVMGARALGSNVFGNANSAFGSFVLQYNEGTNNVAGGYSCFKLNTKGQENTGWGYKCGFYNTTGYRNTYAGFWSGALNRTGYENTASGWYAGRNATSGNNNTYYGSRSGLSNLSGNNNTYLGSFAGFGSGTAVFSYSNTLNVGPESLVVGDDGVGVGFQARVGIAGTPNVGGVAVGRGSNASGTDGSVALGLSSVSSGSRALSIGQGSKSAGIQSVALGALSEANADSTTSIGAQAGRGGTGNRNTFVGRLAGATANAFSNCSLLGESSAVTASNQVQLGDSATTTYVYGTVQNRSDSRDKADIRDTVLGLEFIESLRPVDYRWDLREDYNGKPKDGSKKRVRMHHGFIAQEVQTTAKNVGVEFGGHQDHLMDGGKDVQSLGYDEFIAPLTRAVQELSAMVKAQAIEIEKLKSNMVE